MGIKRPILMHNPGTVDLQAIDRNGEPDRTKDATTVDRAGKRAPRLMSLRLAAQETGISYWTLRDYILDGVLTPVRLPCTRLRSKGGKVIRHANEEVKSRRVYVDREDLERLIQRSKG